MYNQISLDKVLNILDKKSLTKKNTELFFESILTNIMDIAIRGNASELGFESVLKRFGSLLQKYQTVKWSNNIDETYINSLKHEHLRGKISQETLVKLNIRKNSSNLLKQDAYDILVKLEKFYEDEITRELLRNNRESCLVTLYKFASILSLINFSHRGWTKQTVAEKNQVNCISECIHQEYGNNKFLIDAYFGEIKKTIEFSVHYILNSNQLFSEKNEVDFDFPKLAALFTLYSEAKEYRSILSKVYSSGEFMQIDDGKIYLSESIAKIINSQMRKSSEVVYPLESKETKQIYQAFSEEFGYNPLLIEEYIIHKNSLLDYKNAVSCIEEVKLVEDISNLTGQNKENIIILLKELTLYPVKDKNYYSAAQNPENSLFRTSLIKIDGFYLVSNYLLAESLKYFRYRILRNQLSFHKSRHMRNVTKENFDEVNLNILKEILDDHSFIGDTNFPLNSNSYCEHLFNNRRDLPQELDFYVVKDKKLYIMEMKNNDLNRSLKSINKSIQKVNKGNESYLSKLNNLNTVIMDNKNIMHEALKDEFEEIHLFLTFNNPHYLTQGFTQERGVIICSIQDFTDFVKQLIT